MIADEFLRSHLPFSRSSILVIRKFMRRAKNRVGFLPLNRSRVPLIRSLIRKNVVQSIDSKSREASRADKYFMIVSLWLFLSYNVKIVVLESLSKYWRVASAAGAQPPAFTLRETSFWSIEIVNANGVCDLRFALSFPSPTLDTRAPRYAQPVTTRSHSTIINPRAPPICGDILSFFPPFFVCFLFLSLLTLFTRATTVTYFELFSRGIILGKYYRLFKSRVKH